jgi:hypothetical protein
MINILLTKIGKFASLGVTALGVAIFVSGLHFNTFGAGPLWLIDDDPSFSLSICNGQIRCAWEDKQAFDGPRRYDVDYFVIYYSRMDTLRLSHYDLGISGLLLIPLGSAGLVLAASIMRRLSLSRIHAPGFPVVPDNNGPP